MTTIICEESLCIYNSKEGECTKDMISLEELFKRENPQCTSCDYGAVGRYKTNSNT